MAKRIELLSELVPRAHVIALLVNPNNANTDRVIRGLEEAGQARGVRFVVLKADSEDGVDAAFEALAPSKADALAVVTDPFFFNRRQQLVALAARRAIPAIYPWREVAMQGGLASYGTSLGALYREFGIYVGRILNGAKPADLPVQQPTRFELVLNLKTAKALGLTLPPTILARADEVIE